MLKRIFVHTWVSHMFGGQYTEVNPYSPRAIKYLGTNKVENDFDWEQQFNEEVSNKDKSDLIRFDRSKISRQINRAMNIFDQELLRLKQDGELDKDLEQMRILMNQMPTHEELIKAGAIFETSKREDLPLMVERSRELANKALVAFEDQLSSQQVYGGLIGRGELLLSKLKPYRKQEIEKLYESFKDKAPSYPWASADSLQSEREFIKDLTKAPLAKGVNIIDIDMDSYGGHRATFELNNSQIIEFFENDHRLRSPYLKELKKGSFNTRNRTIGYRIYKKQWLICL